MSELDLPLEALTLNLASNIDKDEFIGEIEDVKLKKDRHGRPMLQLWVMTEKYGRVVIALSPSYTNLAVQYLRKMGFEKLGEIIGRTFKFKKVKLEKARPEYTDPYPRFIPVELVK